jgi:ribosome-associated translation inhibitor RaiA
MSSPTVADILRLAHGVTPAERDHVVSVFSKLDERLRSFPEGSVEMQLSIKERDTPSQHATLEAWIARWPPIVSTSDRADFEAALIEVRDDMIRQITDAKNRTEPRNNPARRKTL